MSLPEARSQPSLISETRLVDFQERPTCHLCETSMRICSHSTPSPVIGFEGKYYTKYREYNCGNENCQQYKKGKFRAPNPWRVDRHKYDLDVEAEVIQQRFEEKKTYQEIENLMKLRHVIKISERTVGNIITRYEISNKLGNKWKILDEFKRNGGVFIGIDALGPFKGEDKHIVAMDHFTKRTLLVERVRSENTDIHITFQKKLKRLVREHKIKVLGFMSDDHVAQRKAIRSVWGSKMKHCRCRFHFEKRIMLEAFNLNSKLKTQAKARIRKIGYVRRYREGRLEGILNSKVWEYLLEVIEDLVTMQKWKNKRNDTRLESIIFYERLQDISYFLVNLKQKVSPLPKSEYLIERNRLEILLKDVEAILTAYRQDYEELLRIRGHQDKVKAILDAHKESSAIGLEKLEELADNLKIQLDLGKIIGGAEKYYIEKLYTFVHDRGESLFQYRNIKNATNTNNPQETKFKTLKQTIRRTQGEASASQYLQGHAKYMLFVNPNASREEIKQILMNADYKAIAKIMKEDRALRKRSLSKIKNKKKWDARKKKLKEKLQKF